MSTLYVKEKRQSVSTTETNFVPGFDFTAPLADQGEGVTLVSAVAVLKNVTAEGPAPDGVVGSVSIASPVASVPIDCSKLTVGYRYLLICTSTSSIGLTEALYVELDVGP